MNTKELSNCVLCGSRPKGCMGFDYHKVACENTRCTASAPVQVDTWNETHGKAAEHLAELEQQAFIAGANWQSNNAGMLTHTAIGMTALDRAAQQYAKRKDGE